MKGLKQQTDDDSDDEEEDFRFTSANQKARASNWLKNLNLDDGQFCDAYTENGKKSSFICGNVREYQNASGITYQGFREMRVDMIDIDEDYQKVKNISKSLMQQVT